jgi:hypothetical protein
VLFGLFTDGPKYMDVRALLGAFEVERVAYDAEVFDGVQAGRTCLVEENRRDLGRACYPPATPSSPANTS